MRNSSRHIDIPIFASWKSNEIDTQHEAMFEAGDVFSKAYKGL